MCDKFCCELIALRCHQKQHHVIVTLKCIRASVQYQVSMPISSPHLLLTFHHSFLIIQYYSYITKHNITSTSNIPTDMLKLAMKSRIKQHPKSRVDFVWFQLKFTAQSSLLRFVCLFDLGLTSLSTIFQSYCDGVWMWQGAQCSLLECCLTEISCPRHFDMIFHPVTLYWHWADQFRFLALLS